MGTWSRIIVLRIIVPQIIVLLASLLASAGQAQEQAKGSANSLVARGEYLARAGDCIACHTAPEGHIFSGGRAMPTPFGTLFSSNITPDPETGIGKWTADDFYKTMHTGRF